MPHREHASDRREVVVDVGPVDVNLNEVAGTVEGNLNEVVAQVGHARTVDWERFGRRVSDGTHEILRRSLNTVLLASYGVGVAAVSGAISSKIQHLAKEERNDFLVKLVIPLGITISSGAGVLVSGLRAAKVTAGPESFVDKVRQLGGHATNAMLRGMAMGGGASGLHMEGSIATQHWHDLTAVEVCRKVAVGAALGLATVTVGAAAGLFCGAVCSVGRMFTGMQVQAPVPGLAQAAAGYAR